MSEELVHGTTVRYPAGLPFAGATFLDEEQVGALLRAIPRETVKRLQA